MLVILVIAALYYHGGEKTAKTPVRSEMRSVQEKNATVFIVDENGRPISAEVTYTIGGKTYTIQTDGEANIPENAAFATIYAKGRIPTTIRAIINGRKVVVPLDPTKMTKTIMFKGCKEVFVAPIGAPVVDRFDCNAEIRLPEGIYRFAAADANGCIVEEGNVTLRANKEIHIDKNTNGCKQVTVRVKDAETGAPVSAWITVNGIAKPCEDGSCYVGTIGRCTDVYAWKDRYMRGYDHVCEANTTILLNKAVDAELVHVTTDGNEIVVTDRDGVVIYVTHGSTAEFIAPDNSYYIFAERWPITTRVLATVPGDRNVRISVTPAPARITVKAGETVYVNDAPACRGPKTCELPALVTLRIVNEKGQEKVFVALPGEERII